MNLSCLCYKFKLKKVKHIFFCFNLIKKNPRFQILNFVHHCPKPPTIRQQNGVNLDLTNVWQQQKKSHPIQDTALSESRFMPTVCLEGHTSKSVESTIALGQQKTRGHSPRNKLKKEPTVRLEQASKQAKKSANLFKSSLLLF